MPGAAERQMMWGARSEAVANGLRIRVVQGARSVPLAYADVLALWRSDAAFRGFFTDLLADAPYPAFRWETPAVAQSTAPRPFEFVLLDSPELIRPPDAETFAEHFRDAGDTHVVEFASLGRDAHLVAPCPAGPRAAYAHLGDFVRHAPAAQVHALWTRVGAAMQRRLAERPVWLSTAGQGVAWLHVRLDARPKYYAHRRYRMAP